MTPRAGDDRRMAARPGNETEGAGDAMCMIEDSEGWEFFTSSKPVSRKDHRCDDCGRTIHKGEKYHSATGKYDGEFSVNKVCRHCIAAGAWLSIVCSGWVYGMIGQELIDHDRDEPELRSDVLDQLIAGWRNKWGDGADPLPDKDVIRASIPERARAS